MIQGKWLLIGHRGAGKTEFLGRMRDQFAVCIDLDQEIERRTESPLIRFFESYGEDAFRRLEETTLTDIFAENAHQTSVLIAVGAGYRGRIWPREYRGLWLRRDTDSSPRFFFDRPIIGTSHAQNFLESFIEREDRYQKWADLTWTMREGETFFATAPSVRPLGDLNFEHAAHLTLHPTLHRDPGAAIELRKDWSVVFELRSDLWSADQMERVLGQFPDQRFLISARDREFAGEKFGGHAFDWDVTLGMPDRRVKPTILSLHDFSGGLREGLAELVLRAKKFVGNPQLKAAPIICTMTELEQLWNWWRADPTQRSILPRTKLTHSHPQWQWFRLYMKGRQALHYLREGSEGLRDQPTLNQWIATQSNGPGARFGAVIGDPIEHSYSPAMHHEFFAAQGMNFYAIPLSRSDLTPAVFAWLDGLGACAYAVTSPLKAHPALLEQALPLDPSARQFCNTLVKRDQWQSSNTDLAALREVASKSKAWRIWGSGAIAQQFYAMVEHAQIYSSSKSELIQSKGEVAAEVPLLWAAGDEASLPDMLWKLSAIYDLSYTEKSNARLYALGKRLPYYNGAEFFITQARAQQDLWREL